MVPFVFGGHDWQLVPGRGLFWPARRALIVADLHFEKASWFARTGQYLPPFDSQATLTRLKTVVEATGARELWCLGDNFHDDAGLARLPEAARAMLSALQQELRIVWITGNHDEGAQFVGETMNEAEIDGVILRHEAMPDETRPELSGHFHPKVRVTTPARIVSRPCFLHTGQRLILPAFGALTGGLDVHDPALSPLCGADACAIVVTERRALKIPIRPNHRRVAAGRQQQV